VCIDVLHKDTFFRKLGRHLKFSGGAVKFCGGAYIFPSFIRAESSILLVTPNRVHSDFEDAFEGRINNLVNHLKNRIFNVDNSLPIELIISVIKIIQVCTF
jgi:hypothetical protein